MEIVQVINNLTLHFLPYQFNDQREAQEWIHNYQVSESYKQNYSIKVKEEKVK